jgi:type I restriction enzyme S subunit
LRRPQIVARMNTLSYGVTDFRKRLYWDSFVRVELHLPSIPEQRKIAAHFAYLDSVTTLHERKHAKLLTLRSAMLDKMFPKPGSAVPEVRFAGFSGHWPKVKLKDIGTFKRGIGYGQENVTTSGLLVLRSGNIQNARLVFDSDLQYINMECPEEIRIRKGDIAICMSNGSKALVGKSAICEADPTSPATVGAFCSIFRSVSPIAAQLLQTGQYQKYMSDLLAGSSINNIKNSDICELEFRVPMEVSEQEKVGAYFRNLQDLIGRHEIQIRKLLEIKSAYQQALFA